MKPMPAWLALTCRLLLIVLVPVVLTLTNVRLLMTPLFPNFEYNLPGFPLDLYGFAKEDRLKWSKVAMDYLLNGAGIEFLADLRFPEGQTAPLESCGDYTTRDCTYLYNDRELRHMVDVKNVTRGALWVWGVGGVMVLLSAGALFYFGERAALRAGLLWGAGITLVFYLGIIAVIAVNFNALFVQFHQVFFESGTWTFLFSDTLIRLFPVRFWQDAFIFIGAASILEAALVGAWAWFGVK
jgi:integral membrane protein (TIGR01906 family)